MMIVSVLLMSDSIIAGIFLGSDAVAGITQVTPLYSMTAFFGSLFSIGIPILYSNEVGKFRKEEADRIFGFGFLLSVAAGILLFAVTTIFGNLFLDNQDAASKVFQEANAYLRWMRFSILVLPLQMFISEMVYADGDETISTLGNIVQGAGNIAASAMLAGVMGVGGIGLASFLFNLAALGVFSIHFAKKSNSLKLHLYYSVRLLKNVVRYSMIDAGSYLFLGILTAVLNQFVSWNYGADSLVLVSVIALVREMQMVFDGIGEAVTPIFSIYFGEECYDGVRRIWIRARRTAVIEGAAVTLTLIVFAPFLPKLLDISDPQLIVRSVTGIRILALNSVFVSLLYLLTSYYLVARKIVLGLVISALRDVLVPAPFALLFGLCWKDTGMFLGLAAAPAAVFALSYAYLMIRYGRADCPLLLASLGDDLRSFLFDLTTQPEEIISLQKKIENLLEEHNMDRHTIKRVKLLIEDIFMYIREKNDGKAILCECAILFRPNGIQIITRDEGKIYDLTKEDAAVTSLLSLAVSSQMERLGSNKKYLTSMGFNRSSFLIGAERTS